MFYTSSCIVRERFRKFYNSRNSTYTIQVHRTQYYIRIQYIYDIVYKSIFIIIIYLAACRRTREVH